MAAAPGNVGNIGFHLAGLSLSCLAAKQEQMPGRGTGAGIGLRHGEQPHTQPHGQGGHGLEQGSWSPPRAPSVLSQPLSPRARSQEATTTAPRGLSCLLPPGHRHHRTPGRWAGSSACLRPPPAPAAGTERGFLGARTEAGKPPAHLEWVQTSPREPCKELTHLRGRSGCGRIFGQAGAGAGSGCSAADSGARSPPQVPSPRCCSPPARAPKRP